MTYKTEHVYLHSWVVQRWFWSMLWRFHKFLLYLGYSSQASREAKIGLFCKTVSEFALEYRTTREKLLQQREKKATQRERRRTRGKMIVEVWVNFACPLLLDLCISEHCQINKVQGVSHHDAAM